MILLKPLGQTHGNTQLTKILRYRYDIVVTHFIKNQTISSKRNGKRNGTSNHVWIAARDFQSTARAAAYHGWVHDQRHRHCDDHRSQLHSVKAINVHTHSKASGVPNGGCSDGFRYPVEYEFPVFQVWRSFSLFGRFWLNRDWSIGEPCSEPPSLANVSCWSLSLTISKHNPKSIGKNCWFVIMPISWPS